MAPFSDSFHRQIKSRAFLLCLTLSLSALAGATKSLAQVLTNANSIGFIEATPAGTDACESRALPNAGSPTGHESATFWGPDAESPGQVDPPDSGRLAWSARVQNLLQAIESHMAALALRDFGAVNGSAHFIYTLFNGLFRPSVIIDQFQGTSTELRRFGAQLWSTAFFAHRTGPPLSFVSQWAHLIALHGVQSFCLEQYFSIEMLTDPARSQRFQRNLRESNTHSADPTDFAAYYYQRVLAPLQQTLFQTGAEPAAIVRESAALLEAILPEMRI